MIGEIDKKNYLHFQSCTLGKKVSKKNFVGLLFTISNRRSECKKRVAYKKSVVRQL